MIDTTMVTMATSQQQRHTRQVIAHDTIRYSAAQDERGTGKIDTTIRDIEI